MEVQCRTEQNKRKVVKMQLEPNNFARLGRIEISSESEKFPSIVRSEIRYESENVIVSRARVSKYVTSQKVRVCTREAPGWYRLFVFFVLLCFQPLEWGNTMAISRRWSGRKIPIKQSNTNSIAAVPVVVVLFSGGGWKVVSVRDEVCRRFS